MKSFRKIFVEMVKVFPSYKPTDAEAVMEVYEKHLAQFNEIELKMAVDTIIGNDIWFPSVARFIAAAMEARRNGASRSVDSTQNRLNFLMREQALIDQAGQRIYNQVDWAAILQEAIDTDRLCAVDFIRRRIRTLEEFY